MGALFVNNTLYYLVGSKSIRKVDLATKVNSHVYTFTSEYVFTSIVPSFEGGFVIYAEKPVTYANECIYFHRDGNIIKTVLLPRWYNGPYSTNEPLIAASDTTLYFKNYYFQANRCDSFTPYAMPDCRASNVSVLPHDGSVITIGGSGNYHTDIQFYRLNP